MKKEEVKLVSEELNIEGVIKEATPKSDKVKKEDERISKQQMAMLQKRAQNDLANYKKRLNESVMLKRLQVEEIELNIAYFLGKKKMKELNEEMMAMEAEDLALEQEHEKQRVEAEAKINGVKQGTPRTEEEIKENLKVV
jgi:hypothetical protein